ncbi:DUF6226 family protein [Microbacterium sp. MYb45]|uniref:DUF6226 family protein n=1 Tax=Microbacterium sp. MYb45 TaxID=1827294 RepID=UPI000CFF6CAD|nr:DUF6226 family protein [Microbacterium sp. MYb45]PRB57525.1 hypothetical protein CQ034_17365 [Microbacterium sp. MYb45]
MSTSNTFPGALAPMPDAMSAMLIWPSPEPVAPPRFVEGFELFEAFARDAGTDPVVLAADLGALWDFVAAHPELLDAPETAEAAARFLGNAIAVAHPAARWRFTSEPEVGTSTISVPVAGLLRGIIEHPEQREPFREMLASWPQADRDAEEFDALRREEVDIDFVVAPVPFTRPALAIPEFVDESGRVIAYGSRWAGGSPPEDAYSRVTHPERFAPVMGVVDALVDHLGTWYDVDVDRRSDESGVHIWRLRPTTGAQITLTGTAESVFIQSGALTREYAPSCTCDACDETAESVADQLEETLLAIAAGGLREVFPVGQRRWLHTELRTPDGGGRSGGGEPDPSFPAEELDDAEDLLARLPDGWWPAWTLRTPRS